MYRVGFGDCFLLSFGYDRPLPDGRDERHVLIDCGTVRAPPGGAGLVAVAHDIARRCAGRVDAVVVTHRHRDHLSGFGLKRAGEVFEGLRPQVVARPWTENPAAPAEATGRTLAPADGRHRLLSALADGEGFARRLFEVGWRARRDAEPRALARAARDQLTNRQAIERLDRLSGDGRGEYLSYGMRSRMASVLPGVRVHVLGPPTPDEWGAVAGQAGDNPEYWIHARRRLALGLVPRLTPEGGAGTGVPDAGPPVAPGPVRWLVERMRSERRAALWRIVRALDDAMNNTSLILVFEAGSTRLLFGGDAQIENWEYALHHAPDSAAQRKLLSGIDLYKVGHHGRRNGTPRSLFALWEQAGARRRPMMALLSTLPGGHDESAETSVGSHNLELALKRRTNLLSTADLDGGDLFVDVRVDLAAGAPFERVPAG
jgi:hypothetical protein